MDIEQRMKEFEEALTGGFEHNTLHLLFTQPDDDAPEGSPPEPEVVMFMMDVEYDPVRITYGGDGEISIHADGHKYHMFYADQLEFIAAQAHEAIEMWEAYYEENPIDD